jgi:hypothetical protein
VVAYVCGVGVWAADGYDGVLCVGVCEDVEDGEVEDDLGGVWTEEGASG